MRYVVVNNGSSVASGWTTSSNTCQPIVVAPPVQQCPNGYQPNNTINEMDGSIIYGCIPIQTN